MLLPKKSGGCDVGGIWNKKVDNLKGEKYGGSTKAQDSG